jgi:hypothetical protein
MVRRIDRASRFHFNDDLPFNAADPGCSVRSAILRVCRSAQAGEKGVVSCELKAGQGFALNSQLTTLT